MNAADALSRFSWPAGIAAAVTALAVVAVYAPMAAVAAAGAILAAIFVSRDPDNVLLLALVVLPFANMPLFADNIAGIPGAKPLNVVLAATMAFGLLRGGLFGARDGIERRAKLAALIYLAVFTLEFARSVPNLDYFRSLMPAFFEPEPIRYVLSFYVRNALFLVPFLYVLTFMKDDSERVLWALAAGIGLLSLTIVMLMAAHPGMLSVPRHELAAFFERSIGFHYNTLGTIYLTVGPLLIYLARDRNPVAIANLALAALVILLLQSRSTLLVFALSSAMTLILIRRTSYLVLGGVAVALASGFWLGPTIAAVFSVGIDQGSGSVQSLDDLFTGRVSLLWVPLISQWLADPMLFLFGAGRYGILTSPLWIRGDIIMAMHAHNAFVDFFLDSGIILTGILIAAVVWWLAWSWRTGKRLRSPMYWALFMCPAAYLLGTLTERQFYPSFDNMLLFPILAVMINLVRIEMEARAAARAAAVAARS